MALHASLEQKLQQGGKYSAVVYFQDPSDKGQLQTYHLLITYPALLFYSSEGEGEFDLITNRKVLCRWLSHCLYV